MVTGCKSSSTNYWVVKLIFSPLLGQNRNTIEAFPEVDKLQHNATGATVSQLIYDKSVGPGSLQGPTLWEREGSSPIILSDWSLLVSNNTLMVIKTRTALTCGGWTFLKRLWQHSQSGNSKWSSRVYTKRLKEANIENWKSSSPSCVVNMRF